MFGSFTIRSLDQTEEYPVAQPRVDVGRGTDNDLTLAFPTVSTHHARVLADSSSCRIVDLGSANGTFVNGEEIPVKEERVLHDGDEVQIGPFTLVFHRVRAGADVVRPVVRPGHTMVLPAGKPPRLRITTPEGTRDVPLTKASLTLGRDPGCDVVVAADAVSRRHASLERRGDRLFIRDLGSTNGLSVDGRLVPEHLLAGGQQVGIGQSVTLVYLAAEQAAPEGFAQAGPSAEPSMTVYEIPEGKSLSLGRGAETGVQLAHPQVNQVHAEVRRRQGQVVIQDMGSSNGTYVNGLQVQEKELREGDVVRIGPNQLVLKDGRLQLMSEEGRLRLDAFHLVKTVGKGKRILNDVSLSIKPQEFVAVVGGSGAGKSTLVTALCGFKPATEGAVLLNGVDLYRNFAAYRNEMGYVPQDDIIHVDLSVRKALDYAAKLRMPADTTRAERQQRVNDVIDELDLKMHADKAIRQLSGGQRKRASIGVELLTRPSLFFLDEATSGLDPNTETQMMKLLRKLADQGKTVILITHATKNVMMCDKVCFLARGGYVGFYGPPEEALAYFGVNDFDEIYEKLDNVDSPEVWAKRFLASQQIQEYVVKPLTEVSQGGAAPAGAGGPAPPPSRIRQASGWNQFLILCQRYLTLVAADRKTLLLLLALAPLLGLLDFVIWKRTMLDPVLGDVGSAMSMVFMSCIMGMLVGTLGSVREIVKEKEIYKRERMVSLKLFPYVASKVAVGTLFAIYSGFILFLFRVIAVDYGFLSAQGYLQLLVTMIFIVFSGMMWGLLVSSVAPTEDRAMLLAILVIIPQIVFAGGLMPLSDLGAAGTVGGAVTSTRWAMESMATVSQVMTGNGTAENPGTLMLPGLAGMKTPGEKAAAIRSLAEGYGSIFDVNVYRHWAYMLVIAGGIFLVVLFLQKRKDIL
jgi:ABC transport system ATP-binding/permease protein